MEAALPTYLTLAEAAGLLRCSIRTVRRRIADGELPAERLGDWGPIRVLDADVRALLTPVPTREAVK